MLRLKPGRNGPGFRGRGPSGQGPFGWRRVGRVTDFVVALGLLGLIALAGAVLQYRLGPARSLVGPAQAIDGDSIRLLGEELRLQGLDAPEFRQTCRDDAGRSAYLESHLAVVRRAIAEGVPVNGYYVWSLMDNYEWSLGYEKRFGLIHVDFETLNRVPKASYHALARALAR